MQALDRVILDDREITATYGNSRYCTMFLRGNDCRNRDCFFMHEYDTENELDDSRGNWLAQSMDKAVYMVARNLRYFVRKMIEEEE
ncbi:unnamed protein product [Sphagnum balticum]